GCNPLETLQQKRYVAQRSCYKLDLATSQWSVLRDMKFRRYDHSSVVLDGQIYVIGGQDNGERNIEKIPAPLRSHISSPKSPNLSPSCQDGLQVCRQGQGSRRSCCRSSHTYPCKTLFPTIRLTLLGSDFPCL
ncbi:hypothetical protein AVEN_45175-1, partial [Araneus ventricosus]